MIYRTTNKMEIHHNFNIKNKIYFRIGGIVKSYIETNKLEDIRNLIMTNEKYVIIGEGSNIYFDQTYEGIVIKNCFSFIQQCDVYSQNGIIDNNYGYFMVGSGTILMDFIEYVANMGYDLSNMAGIPGTIGGAIYGNAGAYGVEMKDICECAYLMDNTGYVHKYDNNEMKFGYRDSIIKKNKFFITSCILKIRKYNSPEQINDKIKEIINIRSTKLPPKNLPCAGSFFKNIMFGEFKIPVAKLLDDIGTKNMSSGDICVYENHSNVLVNKGNGTASDIQNLIHRIEELIFEKFGIYLDIEVQYIT